MIREFAVTVYLAFFKMLFRSFNKKPIEKKTTFVTSFGGNTMMAIRELERRAPDVEVVVLRAPGCCMNFTGHNRTVLDMQPKKLPQFIRSIYHLATSSHVFIDNYYGFLAVSDFKKDVTCVQLWHAVGAIKQFGLQDLTNADRSKRALQRFQKVYDRFDYVVVGSEQMERIFKESFGLTEERFLHTGIPRTDFFFDNQLINKARQRLLDNFPIIKDKKMLLYAPTYRDGLLNTTELQMDLDKMYEQFKYEYVLFLRLHPAVDGKFTNKYPGFIYNVSNYPWINDLLVGSDVLITDYSSIPFEYSLLEKPMIFYAYDSDEYAHNRGIWDDYTERVPGPVVYNTNELVDTIRNKHFLIEKVRSFANEWNAYSKGNAAKQLIESIYGIEKDAELEARVDTKEEVDTEDAGEAEAEVQADTDVAGEADVEEDADVAREAADVEPQERDEAQDEMDAKSAGEADIEENVESKDQNEAEVTADAGTGVKANAETGAEVDTETAEPNTDVETEAEIRDSKFEVGTEAEIREPNPEVDTKTEIREHA